MGLLGFLGLRGSQDAATPNQFEEFFTGYITTALRTLDEETAYELKARYGGLDEDCFTQKTLRALRAEAARWFASNWSTIGAAAGQVRFGPDFTMWGHAGHDLWLTRNGHGAGFWDGDWPEDVGKMLTAASERAKEIDLYLGDRGGKLHASGAVNA